MQFPNIAKTFIAFLPAVSIIFYLLQAVCVQANEQISYIAVPSTTSQNLSEEETQQSSDQVSDANEALLESSEDYALRESHLAETQVRKSQSRQNAEICRQRIKRLDVKGSDFVLAFNECRKELSNDN